MSNHASPINETFALLDPQSRTTVRRYYRSLRRWESRSEARNPSYAYAQGIAWVITNRPEAHASWLDSGILPNTTSHVAQFRN